MVAHPHLDIFMCICVCLRRLPLRLTPPPPDNAHNLSLLTHVIDIEFSSATCHPSPPVCLLAAQHCMSLCLSFSAYQDADCVLLVACAGCRIHLSSPLVACSGCQSEFVSVALCLAVHVVCEGGYVSFLCFLFICFFVYFFVCVFFYVKSEGKENRAKGRSDHSGLKG